MGANLARARLIASLSDRSAPTLNTVIVASTSRQTHVATLGFRAASAGQVLTITITMDGV